MIIALPPLENDREFILSLGGEEAIATIGADGKVVFDNPDHLNLLTEEDLLSLRLYLNGDAGNVLWEYHMAGFGPFWSIYPGQQPHAIRKPNSPVNASAATVSAADGDSYYMLGGMRIKVLFQTEQSSTLGEALSVTWKVEDSSGSLLSDNIGNFYPDNNPASDSLGKTYNVSSTINPDAALFETYYQPEQWRTDLDVKITAQVRYSRQSTPKNYSISLKSRELYPVTADNPNIYNSEDSQAPLKGSDVAMLEGLLWQLGYGPNFGKKGAYSVRKQMSELNTFDTGCATRTDGCSSVHATGTQLDGEVVSRTTATMEMMVWRYKFATEVNDIDTNPDSSTVEQTIVNDLMLNNLEKQYNQYRIAVYDFPSNTSINHSHDSYEAWLESAVVHWDNSYDDDTHNAVMEMLGYTTETRPTRGDIIDAIASQESSRIQWRTPYRIEQGGADSHASIGFSQLKSRYVWGEINGYDKANKCSDLEGHNVFNPSDSMQVIAIWSANRNCGQSVWRAFLGNSAYDASYNNAERWPKLVQTPYGVIADDAVFNEGVEGVVGANAVQQGAYELMMKAIAQYNQGDNSGAWEEFTWPEMLKNRTRGCQIENDGNYNAQCNGLNYVIGHGTHGIKLQEKRVGEGVILRDANYVWKDQNPVPQPDGTTVMEEFCFDYGETKWRTGLSWEQTKQQVIGGEQNAVDCPVIAAE